MKKQGGRVGSQGSEGDRSGEQGGEPVRRGSIQPQRDEG